MPIKTSRSLNLARQVAAGGGDVQQVGQVKASTASTVDGLAHRGGDGFDPEPGAGLRPPETGAGARNGIVAAFSASRAEGRAALEFKLQAVQAKAELAADAVPEPAREALGRALTTSAKRIVEALDAGRINLNEAHRSAHMAAEMMSALVAIEKGDFTLEPLREPAAAGMQSFEVRTTENDLIRVSVRPEGSQSGQARVKLYNVEDDGRQVTQGDRVMVRFDLEGSGEVDVPTHAAIDVEYGQERTPPGVWQLNKRIHGVLFDDQGQPRLNRCGRPVADNHFTQGLPEDLNHPVSFKKFVESFLDELVERNPQ